MKLNQKYFPLKLKQHNIIDFNAKNNQLFSLYITYCGVWKIKINGKKVPLANHYQIALNENGQIKLELFGWFQRIEKNILVESMPIQFNIRTNYSFKNINRDLVFTFQRINTPKKYSVAFNSLSPIRKNIYLKNKLLMRPSFIKKQIQYKSSDFKEYKTTQY